MTHEKLLDKLQKLKAHADSAAAIGSEAEAQAFAEKLQRMLLEHDLSMSDLDFKKLEVDDPVDREFVDLGKHGLDVKKNRVEWMEKLAAMIARANFCRILVTPGTSNFWLVGRKEHRAVAEFMIVTLTRALQDIAKKEHAKYSWEVYKKHKSTRLARGFKESFITGFLFRLFQRLEERKKQAEGSTSTALMRVNREDRAVDDYITNAQKLPKGDDQRLMKMRGLAKPELKSQEGIKRGIKAADDVNLDPRAIDRSTGERKELA